MTVIMDDIDEDIESFSPSDDMSGHSLHTPTVTISKKNGDMWKEYIEDPKHDVMICLYLQR